MWTNIDLDVRRQMVSQYVDVDGFYNFISVGLGTINIL